MLVFIASHPSIVILSLYNEDWGAEDITTNIETRRYISNTFDYLRLNYPQLLVVDNDGWNHVSQRGRLSSHLLTAHVYTPSPSGWVSALDRLAGRRDARHYGGAADCRRPVFLLRAGAARHQRMGRIRVFKLRRTRRDRSALPSD
jgi:hypothetical protein